jgi:hypothetical protein
MENKYVHKSKTFSHKELAERNAKRKRKVPGSLVPASNVIEVYEKQYEDAINKKDLKRAEQLLKRIEELQKEE